MKLNFAAAVVLTVAIFGSAAGSATAIERQDEENRAALLRGVSANEEEPKQAHGSRRLGDTNATLTPLPNGATCDSSDHCASGLCHAGVCEALQCFTYDGVANNIPVTEQCEKAKELNGDINCCTDENGNDACEDLRGTVCVTDSLPTCASTSSCTGAGVGYYGDEVLPVRIEPGSCLSAFSCAYLVNSTVASGSCTSPDSCVFTRDITVGELSCNGSSACQKANGAVIMGSSCNAKNACLLASSQLIMGSSCNGESECAYENERDGRGVEYDY